MCGLVGVIGSNSDRWRSRVLRGAQNMSYRGPDNLGITKLGGAIFGHVRLAVVDLDKAANQPMVDEAAGTMMVFNGEIYNYRELRQKLQKHGLRFSTNSDSEVLLKSYQYWGEDCVNRLEGMFAFVIWDQNKCFAARDRFGEKPFYYAVGSDGMLLFASESHVIHQFLGYPKSIDFKGMGQFLSLGYSIADNTLIQGVKKLEPASTLVFKPGGEITLSRYWSLKPFFENKITSSRAQNSDLLADKLDNIVGEELISDVPLGALLSGGLDSSSVVSSMLKHIDNDRMKSFSMSFSDPTFDESHAAKEVARYLNIKPDIGLAVNSPDKVEKAFVSAARVPIADNSYLPMWELTAHTRKSVTVAMSGDGADELFAGYETYRANQLHGLLRHVPKFLLKVLGFVANNLVATTHNKVGFDYKLRQFLGSGDLSSSGAHHWWRLIFSNQMLGKLCSKNAREQILQEDGFDVFDKYWNSLEGVSNLDRARYVDMMTWLPDNILEKVDRVSMSHSLEMRAPFLNHKLAEWAVSVPSDQHLRRGTLKSLLKSSQRNRLPDSIINRKKRGFNAPVSRLLVDDKYSDIFYDRLKNRNLKEYICEDYVDHLISEHRSKRFDHGFRLYTLACLGLWLEKY